MKKVLCSILICIMLLSTHVAFAMPTSEFDKGMQKGISYYNQGLYYETIDEIQNFCDVFWYDMTAEQQEKALYYLWQSKNNLADYLFNTGVGYYNRGLYYEAQRVFVEAIGLYPEYSTSWRNANDFLYNTNERIKSLEAKQTYDNSDIITYTAVNNKPLYEHADYNGMDVYFYKYFDVYEMVDHFNRYETSLVEAGFHCTGSDTDSAGTVYYYECDRAPIKVGVYFLVELMTVVIAIM